MEVQRQKRKKIRQKTTNILSKGRENPETGQIEPFAQKFQNL